MTPRDFDTVLLMVAREVASAEVNHARQRADTRAQHAAEARARAATHKIMEASNERTS